MENFGPLLLTPGESTPLPAPMTTQVQRLVLTNDSSYMVQVNGGANGGAQVHLKPFTTQMIPLVRNEFTGMTATPIQVSAGQAGSNTLWGSWVSPTDDVPGVYPHPHPNVAGAPLPTNVSTFTVSNAAYQAAVAALKPIARWRFDDPAGSTTIADTGASGAYGGTVQGGVTLDYPITIAMQDLGATFDGTSGYVSIPPAVFTAAFSGQTSYGLLVNVIVPAATQGTNRTVLSTWSPATWRFWTQAGWPTPTPADQIVLDGPAGRAVSSTYKPIWDGAQHQIGVAVEDGAGTFYLDGQPSGTFTRPSPEQPAQPATLGFIGQWGNNSAFFQAAIADLMILPALTAEQAAGLQAAANATLTPPVPAGANLVGYSYHGAPPNTLMNWLSGSEPVWHSMANSSGAENTQLTTPIPMSTGPLTIRAQVPAGSATPGVVTGTVLWTNPNLN